jgi:hypothetical protein
MGRTVVLPDIITLAEYRQWILQETEFVTLPGRFLVGDRTGKRIPVKYPLNSLHIRLQLLCEEPVANGEESRDFAQERHILDPKFTDILTALNQYGEQLYRYGQVYRGLERPEPLESEQALQQ